MDAKRTNNTNKEFEINNTEKMQVRELAEDYFQSKLQTLDYEIEKRKEKLVGEMIAYANHKTVTKEDKWGNVTEIVEYSPIVINNRFLKPILDGNYTPKYSAEQLSLVYDYYNDIISEINDNIGHFPSSIISFCKLAGLRTEQLRRMKNDSDLVMRNLVEKIYEQIGDDNVTLSQLGKASERMTMFKLRTQNEIMEKEQPKINVNITETIDIKDYEKRLLEYKDFSNYKG